MSINLATTDERAGLASASRFARVMNCPGSVALEATCPEEPATAERDEGSLIAKALETGDLSELEEESHAIATALQRMEREAVDRWMADYGCSPSAVVRFRERRFWMHDGALRPIASAKVDSACVDPFQNVALIIDHKTGYLDTDPASANWQLRVQAVALLDEYPSLTRIRVAIAQKRIRERYDECEYGPEDLRHARFEIEHGHWRSRQPDAPRYAGEWCRYCRAKAFCREAMSWAILSTVGVDRQDAAAPVNAVRAASLPECVETFARASVAGKIFDAVKLRLKALSEPELKSLGLYLQSTGDTRTINDVALALKLAEADVGYERVAACLKLDLTALREHYRTLFDLTKQEAVEKVDAQLARVLTITPKDKALKIA